MSLCLRWLVEVIQLLQILSLFFMYFVSVHFLKVCRCTYSGQLSNFCVHVSSLSSFSAALSQVQIQLIASCFMFSHLPPNVHNCSAVILCSHAPLQIQITANPKMSLALTLVSTKERLIHKQLWSYCYSSNVVWDVYRHVLSFALTSFALKPSFIDTGFFTLCLTSS